MAIRIVHADAETGLKIVEDIMEEPEVEEGEETPEREKWYQFELSEANKDIQKKLGNTKYMPMPKMIRVLKDMRRAGVLLSVDTEMLITTEDSRLLKETLDSYNDED